MPHMYEQAHRLAQEAHVVDPLVLVITLRVQLEHSLLITDYEMALSKARKLVQHVGAHPNLQNRKPRFGVRYLAYNGLAEALLAHHEWDEAIAQSDRAIDAKFKDGTGVFPIFAVINKAHALRRKGLPDAAWDVLEKYGVIESSFFEPVETFK